MFKFLSFPVLGVTLFRHILEDDLFFSLMHTYLHGCACNLNLFLPVGLYHNSGSINIQSLVCKC